MFRALYIQAILGPVGLSQSPTYSTTKWGGMLKGEEKTPQQALRHGSTDGQRNTHTNRHPLLELGTLFPSAGFRKNKATVGEMRPFSLLPRSGYSHRWLYNPLRTKLETFCWRGVASNDVPGAYIPRNRNVQQVNSANTWGSHSRARV